MITELSYQDFIQARRGHRGRLPGLTVASFWGYKVSADSLEKQSLVTDYRIKNSFTFYDRPIVLFSKKRAIVEKKKHRKSTNVLRFVFMSSKAERTETGTYAQ